MTYEGFPSSVMKGPGIVQKKLIFKAIVTVSLIGHQSQVLAKHHNWAQRQFKLANGPGAIGETGHLHLINQGIFVRPFYNDVMGDTDKHLSGATQLAWMSEWQDSSLELRGHWRFLTPSFKKEFGGEILNAPVGRYADWMELQSSYSRLYLDQTAIPIKLQFSIGFGHVGNKGAKLIHRSFHNWIGSSLEGLDYTQQPDGYFVNRGMEVATMHDYKVLGVEGARQFALGYYYNKFMRDIYLKYNHIAKLSPDFSIALEGRYIYQIDSKVYDNPLPNRWEAAFGVRWNWYRPSVKIISPYLDGDDVGQMYIDPIALYFAF